jgi:CheY-like chemotaxis protein
MIRIMIIEDDEQMRSLMKDFLEEEGFETDSASGGLEGLRILSDGHFDLVITDIRMPGLTGLDILPTIRRLKPEIPIIVVTAYGGDEVRRRCLARGATAYFEKPIHLSQLRAVIGEKVSRKHVRQLGSSAEILRKGR